MLLLVFREGGGNTQVRFLFYLFKNTRHKLTKTIAVINAS